MVVKLVTMKNPCQACLIISDLMVGLFEKISTDYNDVDFSVVKLERPEDLYKIPGLVIEKLPAVIIDDEQVSCGSILHKRQLKEYIEIRR
jgi:hypothetical protein